MVFTMWFSPRLCAHSHWKVTTVARMDGGSFPKRVSRRSAAHTAFTAIHSGLGSLVAQSGANTALVARGVPEVPTVSHSLLLLGRPHSPNNDNSDMFCFHDDICVDGWGGRWCKMVFGIMHRWLSGSFGASHISVFLDPRHVR